MKTWINSPNPYDPSTFEWLIRLAEFPEGENMEFTIRQFSNAEIWQQYMFFDLPFKDIEKRDVRVAIPSLRTYGFENDHVQNIVAAMFKKNDPASQAKARSYWFKKQHLCVISPVGEYWENVAGSVLLMPESLRKVVESKLFSFEPEDNPFTTIYQINRIQRRDGTNEYAVSCRQGRGRAKWTDLKPISLFPPMPTAEMLKVRMEMFEASIAGEFYDPDKWAKVFPARYVD